MPPKSNFWQYFEKRSGSQFATCRLCQKIIKTSGNTSNLKCHIQAKHKEIMLKQPSQIDIATPSTSTSVKKSRIEGADSEEIELSDTDTASNKSESGSKSVATSLSKERQRTIVESLSVIKSHAPGGKQFTKITNSLLFMICRDYQPVNIVENEGFIQLMQTAVPHYKLPSRKTIDKLLEDKYNAISMLFKEKIETADNFTLTCDIWTETMKSKSFLGVTIHFLEGSQILDATLGIYELEERHTSEYIAEKLKAICIEWDIPEDKISCVVTDGAANMTKAVEIAFGKRKHIICFAHILNLVVTKAIEQVDELLEIIKKVKNIVRWFKQSVVASDLLRKAQKNDDVQLSLKQEVPTRWNSTYYMLERFLKLRTHVNAIVNTEISAPPMLTAREMGELQVVVNLLGPFESATCEISGSKYTTGSIIIPLIYNLKNCLSSIEVEDTFSIGTALKLNLVAEISKRLSTADQITILAVATILDPRFKKLYFSNPIHCAKAVESIYTAVKQKVTSNPDTSDKEEGNGNISQDLNTGTNAGQLIISEFSSLVDIVTELFYLKYYFLQNQLNSVCGVNTNVWCQRRQILVNRVRPRVAFNPK